ncbi:MAG: hypothetical protein OEX23_08475 [Betaproteobacteria bacterium]|jgi:hypothetical protein|nr:hypothetical protein [Betaproteobacteria bacterium]
MPSNPVRRAVALVAATSALAFFAPVASGSHSWGGYHWARTANPFTVELGDNVSAAWDAALAVASKDWSASAVLDTQLAPGLANPKNCRPTAGRVEVCNAAYGSNGWLGIATISISGGVHVTQGTVKLNDTYFRTAKYNTPAWRALVMCQEIGHTFGLDHQDENFSNANLGTCMDYTNNPDSNQHPNAHDYIELEAIYSHLDSTNTIGQSTAAGFAADPDHDDPGSWGRLVRQSRGGLLQTYELDHGHGFKTVRFVFWAEERGRRH